MNAKIAEALRLIAEATPLLKHGQPDRAAWRLADAAGLASEVAQEVGAPAPLAGIDEPTGMGFLLLNTRRDAIYGVPVSDEGIDDEEATTA